MTIQMGVKPKIYPSLYGTPKQKKMFEYHNINYTNNQTDN